MQQLQLDSNQIFHSPFFHFALHPPPMWLEAAVRTIEAALPFFLNTIEASKILSRKQLSAAVYTLGGIIEKSADGTPAIFSGYANAAGKRKKNFGR